QVVQMDALNAEEQYQWARRVVRAVNAVFPGKPEDVTTWPQCHRYLEHVQACDTLIQQHLPPYTASADLLDRTGIYLREHASYTLAQTLFLRASHVREQLLGPEHPDVASTLSGLPKLYWLQGKYALAEPLFLRALHI